MSNFFTDRGNLTYRTQLKAAVAEPQTKVVP